MRPLIAVQTPAGIFCTSPVHDYSLIVVQASESGERGMKGLSDPPFCPLVSSPGSEEVDARVSISTVIDFRSGVTRSHRSAGSAIDSPCDAHV